MECHKGHRYIEMFLDLPDAQNSQYEGRHICAGCAYVEGVKDALNHRTPKNNFSHLKNSQAGTVRHKDVKISYDMGYKFGIEIDS